MILKLLIIFGWASLTFAEKPQDLDSHWCLEKDASLDKKQLNCLKTLPASQTLIKNFGEILKHQETCPKCKIPVIDGNQYLSQYHLPFLVLSANGLEHGIGEEIHIIFKERALRELIAWMDYDPDHNTYKLSLMGDTEPSKKMTKLISKLRKKEFDEFWLKVQ